MANKHNELIAKEGWVFFFPLLVAAALCFLFGAHWSLWSVLTILALYVAWFFRNPYRQIPEDPAAIVAPADGKVMAVTRLEDGRQMVTIFLNIFNVHINRAPIAGTVEQITYTPGKMVAAYKEEASQINERNRLIIGDGDFKIEVTQIAGLIARRIVCWVEETKTLSKGERFGLIRFGSRTDVVVPAECEILVKKGDKTRGGAQVIARRVET